MKQLSNFRYSCLLLQIKFLLYLLFLHCNKHLFLNLNNLSSNNNKNLNSRGNVKSKRISLNNNNKNKYKHSSVEDPAWILRKWPLLKLRKKRFLCRTKLHLQAQRKISLKKINRKKRKKKWNKLNKVITPSSPWKQFLKAKSTDSNQLSMRNLNSKLPLSEHWWMIGKIPSLIVRSLSNNTNKRPKNLVAVNWFEMMWFVICESTIKLSVRLVEHNSIWIYSIFHAFFYVLVC